MVSLGKQGCCQDRTSTGHRKKYSIKQVIHGTRVDHSVKRPTLVWRSQGHEFKSHRGLHPQCGAYLKKTKTNKTPPSYMKCGLTRS